MTKDEMEAVEERLADFFAGTWREVAADMGIDDTVPLSDEDNARLQAEFDRRYKPQFIAEALAQRDVSHCPASADTLSKTDAALLATKDLTAQEADQLSDSLYMQLDEVAEELGLTPNPETLRYSDGDQAKIIEHLHASIVRSR